jgi:NADPH-dependent 2,4-dienoyl-CoA reductase/sulfur reductase-like enzyme
MKRSYDFAILGAGPAGLSAAARAAAQGLSVVLLDEQRSPGGQIYRAIEQGGQERLAALGPHYRHGRGLVARFQRSGADYLEGAAVWQITPERRVYYLREGTAGCLRAERLLIATGAIERPVPIPGWTLPGVMGAGAADVLFKSSGLVPNNRVVLAGTGPLLYLVACHLLAAGTRIAGLLDTRSPKDYVRAARLLPAALPGIGYLIRGLAMHAQILKARVPYFRKITQLRASGQESLTHVSFVAGNRTLTLEADRLILHDGVVPNTQMTRLLECAHTWDPVQRYFRPQVDEWGNTSVRGIAVAGDSGGIYGATSAELAGEIAALDTAYHLKAMSETERDRAAKPFRKRLSQERAVRPFLDNLFTPSRDFYLPADDDTLVCRCEEITAGQIRRAASEGGMGPNQVKAKIRCGMGPCQGRMCGLTVAEIIADIQQTPMPEAGYFRVRPPLKPVPLGALANMENSE